MRDEACERQGYDMGEIRDIQDGIKALSLQLTHYLTAGGSQ